MANKRGNNEGTIYKRSNGTYRAQVTLDGERLSFTGQTYKACQDWNKETINRIDGGMTSRGAKLTLEDHLNEWLATKSTIVRPNTDRQYRQIARDYILPKLGSKRLQELKSDRIQKLYNQHIEAGASPRTVQLVHAVLRGSLNHAVRQGLIGQNPTNAVIPPKASPKEKTVLDENQIQAILIVAQEEQPAFFPLYQLALTTGMRQGELLGLSWDDLDWNRGTLIVKHQLQRIKGKGLCLTPPKTKAGHRTIKIGNTTIAMLSEHQRTQFKTMTCRDPDWADKNLVFAQDNGKPIGPRKIQKAFKRILATAGLPAIRFHDLRHTAATHMIIKGVDIPTVSRRLGHTKASTTLDIYAHTVPGLQDKAADIMDEITALVALPADLTDPQLHPVAPGLHQDPKSEKFPH